MATGAAIVCPDRPVLALEGDSSAMYTIQSLWTQAREDLNVTTVIFGNREYAILRSELANVGVLNVGRKALDNCNYLRREVPVKENKLPDPSRYFPVISRREFRRRCL